MLDGTFADSQLSASSIANSAHDVQYGRLHWAGASGIAGAWCAGSNAVGQWYRISLGERTKVTGVITQGRAESGQWVTTFKFQYSDDASSWTFITDVEGNEKVWLRLGHCIYNTSKCQSFLEY